MDEPVIRIENIEIPEWQFTLFVNESGILLEKLEHQKELLSIQGLNNELIRIVHTLSGISNTIGFSEIAEIGHPLEHALRTMERYISADLAEDIIKMISLCVDYIAKQIRQIQNRQHPVKINTVIEEQLVLLDDCVEFMQSIKGDKNLEIENTYETEKSPLVIEPPKEEIAQSNLAIEESIRDVEEINVENTSIFDLVQALDELLKPDTTKEPVVESQIHDISPATTEKRIFELKDLYPDSNIIDHPDSTVEDIFFEEASDIFDKIPEYLEGWTIKNQKDAKTLIIRALHTLKGSSRMAGYMRFGMTVHNIETALEHSDEVFENIHDVLQQGCDALALELAHLQDKNKPSGLETLLYGKQLKTKIITTQQSIKTNTKNYKKLPRGYSQRNITNQKDENDLTTQIKVPTVRIDALSNYLGKSNMAQLRAESSTSRIQLHTSELSKNMERLRNLLRDVELQAETQMRARKDEALREGTVFDPLELDRFSRLQELTRMTAESMNDIVNSHHEIVRGVTDMQDSIAEQHIVADDMQHAVMTMRTISVQSIKRRLELVIRQACRDTNKTAEFHLIGDIEVDSGVLQKTIAPLEHILRNAIAHGIEMPAKRLALGKPESGKIEVSASLEGNNIVFTIKDDGAGIQKELVLKRARQKGLVRQDEDISQTRANQLIFDPGFSTAEHVSELAGRGVGMDIVQSTIAGLGGRINVTSNPGEGTVFDLIVPSYMAVISMVPVRAKNITYAIPAALILDVIRADTETLDKSYNTHALDYQGEIIPFFGLSEIQQLGRLDIERNTKVLIISDGAQKTAVHVDYIDEDRNLVMRPLCAAVASIPGMSGSTIAADGSPLLVINPIGLRHLVTSDKAITTTAQDVKIQKLKTREQIRVLVVDDSMTVRRVTQKFLERERFQVILAKDGLDGIEKISDYGLPDIILSDIEMPVMDGFAFVEHVRTAISKDVPIIMISSRSIDKYADHAKALGVNCSIGKPYQEPELLAVIEELTQTATI